MSSKGFLPYSGYTLIGTEMLQFQIYSTTIKRVI